jgi:hypothetical protein
MTDFQGRRRLRPMASMILIAGAAAFAMPTPPASARNDRISVRLCGTAETLTITLPDDGRPPEPPPFGKSCHACDLRKRSGTKDDSAD